VLATRALLLNASMAYTRATIRDWNQGPCYSGAKDCTVPNVLVPGAFVRDASGGTMPNSPKWKTEHGRRVHAAADGLAALPYRRQRPVRTQSQVRGAISQDPSLDRPGYGIFDLGARFSDAKGKYKLSVGVKNLFDQTLCFRWQSAVLPEFQADQGIGHQILWLETCPRRVPLHHGPFGRAVLNA
jgi:iron complex outermembrane receptor protein